MKHNDVSLVSSPPLPFPSLYMLVLKTVDSDNTKQQSAEVAAKLREMSVEASSGEWLVRALSELSKKIQTGIDLDDEIISGLVSYCEMASPLDAKEYLDNIIGEEAGKHVTDEYLKRRGYSNMNSASSSVNVPSSSSNLHAYVKPRQDYGPTIASKKPQQASKESASSSRIKTETPSSSNHTNSSNQTTSRKKKTGKVISLAEAAKGSIVFQKGKPCSCQARRHKLVSNCLSCGKIVCEQEGEGPCSFCGALVLREGSDYAGLNHESAILTDAEATAEAFAKRLVEYDRNSAARTTVIDDQSDYYNIEGNSWLSNEEKELLRKKREELDAAELAKRSRVVLTFDLLGRKVLLNEDEAVEEMQSRILLQPPEDGEDVRIKPNPNLKIQPIFIDPGPRKTTAGDKDASKALRTRMSLEISGRVQYERNALETL